MYSGTQAAFTHEIELFQPIASSVVYSFGSESVIELLPPQPGFLLNHE